MHTRFDPVNNQKCAKTTTPTTIEQHCLSVAPHGVGQGYKTHGVNYRRHTKRKGPHAKMERREKCTRRSSSTALRRRDSYLWDPRRGRATQFSSSLPLKATFCALSGAKMSYGRAPQTNKSLQEPCNDRIAPEFLFHRPEVTPSPSLKVTSTVHFCLNSATPFDSHPPWSLH